MQNYRLLNQDHIKGNIKQLNNLDIKEGIYQ